MFDLKHLLLVLSKRTRWYQTESRWRPPLPAKAGWQPHRWGGVLYPGYRGVDNDNPSVGIIDRGKPSQSAQKTAPVAQLAASGGTGNRFPEVRQSDGSLLVATLVVVISWPELLRDQHSAAYVRNRGFR
jgi:hypothetical protein